MVSMVVYSEDSVEIKKMKKIIGDIIPIISEAKWNLRFCTTLDAFKSCMEKNSVSDLFIFDITGPDAMDELEMLRRTHKEAFLLIIANMDISPMSYMKPSIKATSLLLRPIEDEKMNKVLKEFLIDFIEKQEEHNPEHVFQIETKGEVQYIPYDKIYYFEARKRKLYLRTLSEEYAFVNTVDNLEQMLGEQFIRCHRSFIVNSRKIVSIALADNMIKLTNELVVPLSRGYRGNIKKTIGSRKQL